MRPSPLPRVIAALLLLSFVARADPLAQRIDKILSQAPARRAFWGIKVLDLDSGRTLYQLNADRLFVPASNTKLFSTALALTRLGPEHRFLTRLVADAPPDEAGRIAGDLVLIGGGDPNFSSRLLPFEKQSEFSPNRLAPIEELAAEVAAAGVRQIDGDVVGDDTYYIWQRYQQGWALEDIVNDDGPPITALVINDNTVTLRIRPGPQPGDTALVSFEPPSSYFTIENRVRTTGPERTPRPIRLYREPGERIVRVSGEISTASKGRVEPLAIDDPALFAAQALHEALLRHSITVLGRAASRHAFPWELEDAEATPPPEPAKGWTLASRSSMPLFEDLRITNKSSQNLHAELWLRAVARERRGIGSREASTAELKRFLAEAGVNAGGYFLRDGSGLSRQNLVSPATLVALLAYMWKSPQREPWLDSLSVGGVDGTLRGRFLSVPLTGHVRAKTGSLQHVRTLSGYLEKPGSRRFAFSIMVNNYPEDTMNFRGLIDQICGEILR